MVVGGPDRSDGRHCNGSHLAANRSGTSSSMKDDFYGKRIVILGLARQGKALARFASAVGAEVIASDLMAPEMAGPTIDALADVEMEFVFGSHPISLLDNADVLAISGGVPADAPIVQEARARGIRVTNDSQEFMKRVEAPVIGITGSAGKTTTTALTGSIIHSSGRTVWVGGNIGRPLIAELDAIEKDDVVVQELSSFQLELWTMSPDVAAVLNVTPNHLNRHGTMEVYSSAKANILRYQKPGDIAVLSADDQGAAMMRSETKGRLREFSLEKEVDDGAFSREGKVWLRDGNRERSVLDLDLIPLLGRHNVLNVLASTVLADSVNVPAEAIRDAVATFDGVEHRLEKVGLIDGVQFINDSIATAPERAMAAVDSFTDPIILLAGGRDKKMVWDDWARRVVARVKVVILFGELADLMETHLRMAAEDSTSILKAEIIRAKNLEAAAWLAYRMANPGDIVLLAPGGTSFDAFSDFAERGNYFREIVNDIAARSNNVERTVNPRED
jgi:UDP-N-acetylmuramoylalanine--D-glutamate ligase